MAKKTKFTLVNITAEIVTTNNSICNENSRERNRKRIETNRTKREHESMLRTNHAPS